MAKSNPNLPTVDITGQDPITGYITSGISDSTPVTTAGYFAIGCILENATNGLVYSNVGTVAVPVWNSISEVTSAEIDPALIQNLSVNLSAAQIKALYTTSVEIIPAVANKSIILDSFVFDLTGTATQFANGGVVNLQYDSTANGAGTTLHADIAATVLTGATARVQTIRIPKDLSAIATASITGKGVYIGAKTADFITGTGTAVCKVTYHLI